MLRLKNNLSSSFIEQGLDIRPRLAADSFMDASDTPALEISKSRETKGARTRRMIMAEARAMIDEMNIEAISQDAVARRVGITQSALRHHFPTKEALFDAIFEEAFAQFYKSAEKILNEPLGNARTRLVKLCAMHLDQIGLESDRVTIGSFAHHLYNPSLLGRQSAWYHWIAGHYAALLRAVRPDLSLDVVQARALALLTMAVGGWITIGRSRPDWPALESKRPASALLEAIEALIDG